MSQKKRQPSKSEPVKDKSRGPERQLVQQQSVDQQRDQYVQNGRFQFTIGKEDDKFSDSTLDPSREGPGLDPAKWRAMRPEEQQKYLEVLTREDPKYALQFAAELEQDLNVGKEEERFADSTLDPARDPDEKKRLQALAAAASQTDLEAQGQELADQIATRPTTLDEFLALDLPPVPAGTILRFAFSPDNLQDLNMAKERMEVEEVANVLTINNPTPALMSHLIQSGQFTDAIFSGHGDEDGIFITGADGRAEHMSSEDLQGLLADSSIFEMLLNFCNGGQKTADLLNEIGIATVAHDRAIQDSEAIGDAAEFGGGDSIWDVDVQDQGAIQSAKRPEAPSVEVKSGPEPVISWSGDVNNAIRGFNVYRNGEYLTTVKDGKSWTDPNPVPGANYQVTSFDVFGRYSDLSAEGTS